MVQNPTTALLPRSFIAPLVGNVTPVQICPSNPGRISLYVYNPSATVTIAIAPADATPAVNGQGITIPPLTGVALGGPNDYAFTNAIVAIASAGTTNVVTVWEW